MATLKYGDTEVKRMTYDNQMVKKWIHDNVVVFLSGNNVNYHIDINNVVTEFVNFDDSVLSPTTFTPTKSGYVFVGWREDTVASSTVLNEKVMGDTEINLYAVFSKVLTATFNGNGATGGSTASISGTQYYNNSNIVNPIITLPPCGYIKTDYTFTGWNYGAVGAQITLTDNITVLAQWKQSILRLVTNGSLGSGVGSSLVAGYSAQHGYFASIYANGGSFPYSVTPVKVRIMSDGDDEANGGCIIRLTKPITGNGRVYFDFTMANIMSSGVNAAGASVGMTNAGIVVELINASSGAHTILWQQSYNYNNSVDWSSGGYYYKPPHTGLSGSSVYINTNAVVPSGTYYIQFVFHHTHYGSGNPVYECSINNCYVTF